MTDTLRDERAKGWFHIDNAIVDECLPLIGHTAFAVYALLVRNVNADMGYAYPSYTTMQKKLGIGRNQVAESIKRLVEHGLVRVDKGDGATVNHYYITTPHSLAQKLVSPENQSRSETETSFPARLGVVSERDSIKTYLKRPIEKDLVRERESARARAPTPPRPRIEIPDPFPATWIPEFAREHSLNTKWTEQAAFRYVLNYADTGTRRTLEEWTNKCQKWILEDHEKTQQRPMRRTT